MGSRFLFNAALWKELSERVPRAKPARVAVAYLGVGAARLLPLKKGDQLVVDMSLRAVRCGTTDPREVRTYLRRGVRVFSRECLHAKFFVLGKVVIAGSANISSHSKNWLDEAAVMTDDPSVLRRTRDVLDHLCTEPVRSEYLKKCLKEYRSPKFGNVGRPHHSQRKATSQGKVWLIGGLRYIELPDHEETQVEKIVERAAKRLRDFERCEVDWTRYVGRRPRFVSRLRPGDWVVTCIRDGSGFDVWPPARFLGVDTYRRKAGRPGHLLLQESPTGVEPVRWSAFRRAAPSSLEAAQRAKPRTAAIVDEAEADAVLRLWDARGRFRPRKRR